MNNANRLSPGEISLRRRIKEYKSMAMQMEQELKKAPFEWGKYQSLFNAEMNKVFSEIMDFERENLKRNREESVYKLKNLFVNRIRNQFLHGDYIVRSLKKPFGYAGDHKIIDDIYLNRPTTDGFGRLFDNYFQMSAISVAVRNRKDDFKRFLTEFITGAKASEPLRVLDLACGPARDLYEFYRDIELEGKSHLLENLYVDCFDNDQNALDYAKNLLSELERIDYIQENAVRLALKKDIRKYITNRYNFIYSTGLFDYFDDRIIIRLLRNLKELLRPGGTLAISDVRDKYSNPSVHFMEWVGDWNLIYREDNKFRELFLEAGFSLANMKIGFEQQGIMQYILATKSD